MNKTNDMMTDPTHTHNKVMEKQQQQQQHCQENSIHTTDILFILQLN